MKNAKKDKRAAKWKLATGVILVCVLAVAVSFGCMVMRRLRDIGWVADTASWQGMQMRTYPEVRVSDDGQWYLIPEVGLKFPFFATMEYADRLMMGTPLRYNANYYLPEEVAAGFRVQLTYDLLDKSIMGEGVDERWPTGCLAPFVFDFNFSDSDDRYYGYETVAQKVLANGRIVELKKRTIGGVCLEFIESQQGEFVIEYLSKFQSY